MATNTVAINIKGNTTDIKAKLNALTAQLSRLGASATGAKSKMTGLGGSFTGMLGKASALTAGFIGVSSAIRGIGSAINVMASFGAEMSKVRPKKIARIGLSIESWYVCHPRLISATSHTYDGEKEKACGANDCQKVVDLRGIKTLTELEFASG